MAIDLDEIIKKVTSGQDATESKQVSVAEGKSATTKSSSGFSC